MNNNDRLARLRYALDIKDADMAEVFRLGGMEMTKEEVQQLLRKVKQTGTEEPEGDDLRENQYEKICDDWMLESFLNGLIVSQRGVLQPKAGETPKAERTLNPRNANNELLKKIKIALSLTSEDMLAILAAAGVSISKSELSAVLRKEGHRNYKACGDRYARNFLKGLALRYRN